MILCIVKLKLYKVNNYKSIPEMSINVCSITGLPLSKPVASRKTGHLY